MTRRELDQLKRSIRDTKSKKEKLPKHHQEDQDWLDWAVVKARKYGPELLALLEGVL